MSASIARRFAAFGIAAFTAVSTLPASAQDVLGETGIKGAGSTFVYPVLSRWSREYREWLSRGGEFPVANSGLEDPPASSALEYEPVGSLAGTLRVKDRAVDFEASDMRLKSEELATLGLGQFPIVIGGVVVAVNIDGVGPGEIRLTGPLLADVFLGKITNWPDPAVKELNPAAKLPDARIVVVHRSDGSGTTFNFTDYLSKASPEWKLKVGSALIVPWPTGTGAKGNEGVGQAVKQARNSIGYVDYGQALQLKLSYALPQNRAGRFIKPETASFQAAAASADWGKTSDFYLERRRNAQHFDPRPLRGIGDGLWWAAVTMTTTGYGDKIPVSWSGRVLGLVWMFCSIFMIALFSATMASTFVVNRLKTGITGPGDLPRVRVAAVSGTAGEQWLAAQGMQARTYPFVIQASKALQRGDVDALIHERAILGHMINNYGWRELTLLPQTLAVRDYAMALPVDSPIKEPLNRALLKVVHQADWGEVVQRYVGTTGPGTSPDKP